VNSTYNSFSLQLQALLKITRGKILHIVSQASYSTSWRGYLLKDCILFHLNQIHSK